jgi:hypothetical protein
MKYPISAGKLLNSSKYTMKIFQIFTHFFHLSLQVKYQQQVHVKLRQACKIKEQNQQQTKKIYIKKTINHWLVFIAGIRRESRQSKNKRDFLIIIITIDSILKLKMNRQDVYFDLNTTRARRHNWSIKMDY